MSRVVIAGSREKYWVGYTFQEILDIVNQAVIDSKFDITEVVSGKATGIDAFGEIYAKQNGIPIKEFPAQWDLYPKAAGPIRNREMAEYCDAAIVVCNGFTSGSSNMIKEMERLKKPVFVRNVRLSGLENFYE